MSNFNKLKFFINQIMLKLNKNLIILIIFFLTFSFCYGFVSHRNQIFPYNVFKKITNILSGKQTIIKDNLKIREKYKNWNEINKNFKPITEIFVKKYTPGVNIFSDRHYFNHINDEKLVNFRVIQLPKHYTSNIELHASNEVSVYRALCDQNNNDKYQNWEKVNFEILIISHSCIFRNLVKKKFEQGQIVLSAGGPRTVDPIFIFSEKKDIDLKIIDLPAKIFLVPAYKLTR